MLVHPPLHPAFRVRRGERSTGVDTTRHDGSRASGYPPDFVSFRRRAGALSAGAARRHRLLGRSRPPSLWCALFGNATKSAGCANRVGIFNKGKRRMTDSSGDARDPTTRCNGARRFSTDRRRNSRPRIERNELDGLTRPHFYLVILIRAAV